MQDMRDLRHAKAMASTLRAVLAAKGLKITVSESLELIAKAFGVADWNTLSAAVRAEAPGPRNDASPSPPAITQRLLGPGPHFSRELESTLHRALADANHRELDYATLEHLLLALIDDLDASAVMKACNVDLGALKRLSPTTSTTSLGGRRTPTATTPDQPPPFSGSFGVP